jgi:hypothetical protein
VENKNFLYSIFFEQATFILGSQKERKKKKLFYYAFDEFERKSNLTQIKHCEKGLKYV